MNLSQIRAACVLISPVCVFTLAALIAPQSQSNHPAYKIGPVQLLAAADHQTEIGFTATLSSARLTFDVSRLTLLNPDSAVTATSLSEARHA